MASRIPVRNWYYLYAYAWDQFELADRLNTGEDFGPNAPSFFAHILLQGCERLFRRGLDRSYRSYKEERTQLRGKIDVLNTARHDALRRARVWCEFDELEHDSLSNRLIKATLASLAEHEKLDPKFRRPLKTAIKALNSLGVADIKPRLQLFRRIQIHRSNALYAFLLHLCELANKMLFPEQGGRAGQFASLPDDEKTLHRIFERFVRNFYKSERKEFSVCSERIEWDRSPGREERPELLPIMQTDVSLRGAGRTIIIDTKFYSQTLSGRYDRNTLHSGNLYQIFAYLKNLERRGGPDQFAEGILLYPTVTEEVDHSTMIQGHKMSARTIDMTMPWESISARLRSILDAR